MQYTQSSRNLKGRRNAGHPVRKGKQHIVAWKYDTRVTWTFERISPAITSGGSKCNAPLVSVNSVGCRPVANYCPGWICSVGGSRESRTDGEFSRGHSTDYWSRCKGAIGIE